MSTRRTASAKPSRRQRAHGVLPAGFVWRDGRPRWLPSPTRRRQGWKPVDLAVIERGAKVWMGRGDAITRCEAINAAVAAWTDRAQPVPADMADFAPPGSVDGSARTPAQKLSARAIGALVDDWLASPRFTLPRGQGGLSPTTAADYRSKINVLLIALVQSDDPVKVAKLRAEPIDALAAPEEEGDPFLLDDAYQWLLANRGHPMAYGVMQVASVFFTWCWRKKRIKSLSANPVDLVDRTPPAGKVRVGTQDEIAALLTASADLKLHSIGDAILLALDLGWSLQDLLGLDWRRVQRRPDPATGADGWVITRVSRGKTAIASSDIPLMAVGRACVERIIARNAAAGVTPTHLIVREASQRNRSGLWTRRAFNDAWNQVRAKAAQACPSLLTGDGVQGSEHDGAFNFMDLRDTFITLAHDAGLDVAEVCKRSLHADHAYVLNLWKKHYGSGGRRVGLSGARKMGALLSEDGWLDRIAKVV
ncbi:MAG: hypothetical protein ACK4Z5_12175 [Brevundimonas sp.]